MCSYKEIIRYRNIWMAIAAILIVYCHASLPAPGLLFYVKEFSYAGVDIFVFASGIGCYHSLTQRYDPLSFFKKRFFRIIPVYYIVLIPWLLYQTVRSGLEFPVVAANLLCVDFLLQTSFETLWYMNAVWIYYLLAIFMVPICNKFTPKKKLAVMILCYVYCLPFIGDIRLMLFSRIPLFLMGILFAVHGSRHQGFTPFECIRFLIGTTIGIVLLLFFYYRFPDLMLSYGLHWWPFLLIVPGFCLILSLSAKKVEKAFPQCIRILNFIGKCTLEIYAIHSFFFVILHNAMDDGLFYGTDKRWLIFCIIPFILSGLLVKFRESLSSKFLINVHHKQQGE